MVARLAVCVLGGVVVGGGRNSDFFHVTSFVSFIMKIYHFIQKIKLLF